MYHIGVDLGGTNIAVGVVTENHEIIGRGKMKTDCSKPAEDIVKDMVCAVKLAVENAGISMDEVSDIGIAAPGSVDPETGDVAYANNLPFHNTPVCSWMQEQLGKPCYIDNDANAAAYGELLAGAGKGASNFIMVTLGTGVGGGVIIDGKIYGGFNHAGAELGHMIIVRDGEQCTCGNKGCYEAYGSATALIRQTKAAMDKNPDSLMWELSKEKGVSGRTAFDAMRAGDQAGKQVVDDYIGYLACGLINLVNIFQPEFVAIGGGICNEGETLLAPLRELVAKGDYNKVMPKKATICTAALGNDAGIIGAAGLYRLK
jgi:glucokinase